MNLNNIEKDENEKFGENLLCQICHNTDGEYKCQSCLEFKILCSKCDSYIHSLKNKLNHKREIIKNKSPNEESNNFHQDECNVINKSSSSKSKNPITSNYLEQIREIYEQNKKNILNENYNYFLNSNKDLEKRNSELKNLLNERLSEYTKEQNNYKDSLTTLEFTFNKLQKEKIDIKEYYESKQNFLIEDFNREKRNLINSYERNIEELMNNYNTTKNKYINYLEKRMNDISNNEKENKKVINELKDEIKYLTEVINGLKNRKEELINKSKELKFDNTKLKEKFEKMRKELKFETIRKENEIKKVIDTQRDFYKVKKENKKIAKRARSLRSKSVKNNII